jgi:rod shape-determining protein MreC
MLEDEGRSIWRRIVPVLICIVLGTALGIWHKAAIARGANDPVTNALRTVLSPVVRTSNAVADWFGRTAGALFRSRSLARENARLRRQVAALTEEINDLREAGIRAERLESALGFVRSSPPTKLPAQVIALGPSQSFETLVIGRGTRDGVGRGAVVVSPAGLVGHVYDVAPTTATVMLASDPRGSVGAMVQRAESRVVGICRGVGGRILRFGYLHRESDVRVGDILITSGLGGSGGVFPKGLVIGAVTSVREDPATSAKSAIVRLAVTPDRLEEVVVLR